MSATAAGDQGTLISDLAERLRPYLPDIALAMLGKPSFRSRGELRFGDDGRLVINLAGNRAEQWHDFSSGGHGDALDLLVRELGSREAALDYARRWLNEPAAHRPSPRPKVKPAAPPPPIRTTLDPHWSNFWQSCRPITPGSIAEQYLQGRGCVIPPADGDLRWHPSAKHPNHEYVGPALVGLVTDVLDPARAMNLHRTWITPGGKADIERPRSLLFNHPKAGGVIRLWADEAVSLGLGLAEGIETALSLARRRLPVWAAIDAGNLAKFPILPGIECLSIAVDHDPAGIRAALELGQRWRAAGYDVRMFFPDQPGKDWNDVEAGR